MVHAFCTHSFTTQLASYFAQDSLFFNIGRGLIGKHVTTFHSSLLPQNVHSSVLFPMRVVCQQLGGSHETVCTRFLGVISLIPDH